MNGGVILYGSICDQRTNVCECVTVKSVVRHFEVLVYKYINAIDFTICQVYIFFSDFVPDAATA